MRKDIKSLGEAHICKGCNISHPEYCREGQPKPYVDCPDLNTYFLNKRRQSLK
jgi:hypothetical protein